jgi:acyl-CoA hydrolase
MDFFHKIKADQDFKMNGYVMYVSKSSLVVGIDLFTKKKDSSDWEFLGNASHILAARTMDNKPYKVPQISFSGEDDLIKWKSRFEYGYHVQHESLANKAYNEYHNSPTDTESEDIHDLLFTMHQQRQLILEERRAFVPLEKTINSSYILIQPQRNVFSDYASGGYILKEAYELSHITGHLFCERQPFEFVGLDRLYYPNPWYLGNGYEITTKVTYSDEEYFRVNASLNNIVREKQELKPTELNFTFKFSDNLGKRKRIMPSNYDEALIYLMNKRMLNRFLY